MHFIMAAMAALLSLAPVQSAGESPPMPALGDECAVPARWDPPFTRAYTLRNGATLVFVAVTHGRDLDGATFKQIKAAFDLYKPGVALVEGASSAKSKDDAYLRFLADTSAKALAAGTAGESQYAVKLATDAHVRFSGWDFSPDQDDAMSVDKGFAIADVVGAHLLRSHVDPFAPEQRRVDAELRYAGRVRPIAGFDYAAWYRKAYGDTFDPALGTPCSRGISGEVIKYETARRNANLIALIDDYAKPGAVVLVEAGAGHWLALKDYLASVSKAPPRRGG